MACGRPRLCCVVGQKTTWTSPSTCVGLVNGYFGSLSKRKPMLIGLHKTRLLFCLNTFWTFLEVCPFNVDLWSLIWTPHPWASPPAGPSLGPWAPGEGSSETRPCGATAVRGPLVDRPPGAERSTEEFRRRTGIGTFAAEMLIPSSGQLKNPFLSNLNKVNHKLCWIMVASYSGRFSVCSVTFNKQLTWTCRTP